MEPNTPPSHADAAERRAFARVPAAADVTCERAGGEPIPARLVDVSRSGLGLRTGGDLPVWAEIALELPGIGRREARVARRDGERYGCLFREQLEAAELDALLGAPGVRAGAVEEPDGPAERKGRLGLRWGRAA